MLAVALGFALSATVSWYYATLYFQQAWAKALLALFDVLNFGGDYLAVQAYRHFGPDENLTIQILPFGPTYVGTAWLWWLAFIFLGALIQGLVYAAIGSFALARRHGRTTADA